MVKRATATARANIALAKYWGKADASKNLPAVPSLSLTLDGLCTKTSVTFDGALPEDQVVLDGRTAEGRPRARVIALLDRVRADAGLRACARVESTNDFPTAAGLASSASGFAALALAATRAAGLEATPREVSALARRSSASAARSVWGGYVQLGANAEHAEPLVPWEHFPLHMLVAVTARGPKPIGSTEAMQRTASTSPYYGAWVTAAPRVFEEIRRAIVERDIERLGAAMEHSALSMHACALSARPPIRYFTPSTIAVLDRLRKERLSGALAFPTMDAGPHVKILSSPEHAEKVRAALESMPEVHGVLHCKGGANAAVVVKEDA